MKIVLDTNVVVSGVLNPYGPPGVILAHVIAGDLTLLYDARIRAEYEEVLLRKEFAFSPEQISSFLDSIDFSGDLTLPASLPRSLPDQDDNAFLEVALAGRAEALITGNLRHFPATHTAGIPVLSPADFLKRFQDF